jgi:hypothetical protein
MGNHFQHIRDGATKRCPICDGKFGLIRCYSWRTALCSKKCLDRFRARQEIDRKWLCWPIELASSAAFASGGAR